MKLDSIEQCRRQIERDKKIIKILREADKELKEDMDKWEEQACKDMYHENA